MNILLIDIVLVVFITVHYGLVDTTLCEDLIHSTNLFEYEDENNGILNFDHAFSHYTLDSIQTYIDNAPGNEEYKTYLGTVTFGYFYHLLGAAYNNTRILGFHYPEVWCTITVYGIGILGHIRVGPPSDPHVMFCYGSIVPGMIATEGYVNSNNLYAGDGKQYIINIMYGSWSIEKLQDMIQQNSSSGDYVTRLAAHYMQNYAVAYFHHVATYAKMRTGTNVNEFKTIEQYCNFEGNDLLNNLNR